MKNKNLIELIDEFLVYKRSNGYVYSQGEYYLKKYMAFLADFRPAETIPTKDSIEAFLSNYVHAPGSLYNVVAVLREFGRYLIARGYSGTYLIPAKRVSLPTPVKPYFFTSSEITLFFKACDEVKKDPHIMGRHLVIPAMFRTLYCCGLRCKEVRILHCKNVHLEEEYLDILQSKGPKSRRIFISKDLAKYLKNYDQEINTLFPNRKTFFPNRKDQPYGAQMLTKNFHRLWYKAFPEMKHCDISIRPYDFRHHFAYANMNKWLYEGVNINAMLPYLMNYMGHSDVDSTLYYFHLVPDIYGNILEKLLPFESLIPEV